MKKLNAPTSHLRDGVTRLYCVPCGGWTIASTCGHPCVDARGHKFRPVPGARQMMACRKCKAKGVRF